LFVKNVCKSLFLGHHGSGSKFHTVQDIRPAVPEGVDCILFGKATLWCSWRGMAVRLYVMLLLNLFAFGALALLVGHQEEHLACKN